MAWYAGSMIKGGSLANLIELPFVVVSVGALSALRSLSLMKKGVAVWYFPSCYVLPFLIGLVVPALPE
ncbi:hypothetical protein [Microbulbifer sp. TRSA007]|uniref:hypothetical protein n=1 Tax=Microbulbifer sp. TRSA007 TaxID=3243384 RepID=UPI00403A4817